MIPLPLPALSLALALTGPTVAERFPDDTNPSHVLLIVDMRTGEVVRSEAKGAAETEGFPPGQAARFLFAFAGLEEGTLDADSEVECDSTCWAAGSHGTVDLVTALAISCDSWFVHNRSHVSGEALRRHAERLGFGTGLPSAAALETDADFPPPDWRVSARQWVDFWRALPTGKSTKRVTTASTLLAAGAAAVSSPRGVARTLADPTRLVRASVGETPAGAWVAGTRAVRGEHPWAFALWVRGASANLAVTRADHLLRETIRVWKSSTQRRAAEIPKPLDLENR